MKFNLDTNLIAQFLRKRKIKTINIVVLGLIANLLSIIIPVSIGKYYRLAFHLKSRRVGVLNFIPDAVWNTVPKFLLLFSALITIRFVFFFLFQYYLKKEGEFFVKQIKDYLFEYQLKIKYSIYREKGIGKYLLRYTGDINSLKNLYLKGTIRVFVDVSMIVIAMLYLFVLNFNGAIVIVVVSLFSYGLIRIINKKVEYYSLNKRNKNSGQLSFVSRTLNSILTVILFNKQEVELKKYKKKSKAVKNAAIIYNKWFIINKGLISFFQYAILAVVLYVFYLGNQQQNGKAINQSNLISFILLYLTILPVIRRLFSLESVYKLGNISLRKLNNIIRSEKEDIEKGLVLVVHNPRISFKNVQFSEHNPISFVSKKMTCSELFLSRGVESIDVIASLTRINDEYVGQILINNHSVKDYSPQSLRANIGVVSPKIPLIGRTVYEAITESRSSKTKTKIQEEFIGIQSQFGALFNMSIDDKIGENGSNISTLQYELLCFVRGVMMHKKILIVDDFSLLEPINKEAFSAILKGYNGTVLKMIY